MTTATTPRCVPVMRLEAVKGAHRWIRLSNPQRVPRRLVGRVYVASPAGDTAWVTYPAPSEPANPKSDRMPLLGFVLAVLASAALAAAGMGLGFAWLVSGQHSLNPRDYNLSSAELYDVARSTVAGLGLLGISAGAAVAFRRQWTQEAEHALDVSRHHAERASDVRLVTTGLRERFTTATTQLGADDASVRVAGVYALAQLADDWRQYQSGEREQQVCIDALCAYLRMPIREAKSNGGDVVPDVRVRETIVSVMAEALRAEQGRDWRGRRFDLTGADLRNGTYKFSRATFSDGEFVFDDLLVAEGELTFSACTFSTRVSMRRLTLKSGGSLSFVDATMRGAAFLDLLDGRWLGGKVSFVRAKFVGGELDLARANIDGTDFLFDRAEFSGTSVSFQNSALRSGAMSFTRSQLLDGRVTFRNAKAQANGLSVSTTGLTGRAGVLKYPIRAGFDQATIDGLVRNHALTD